MYTREYRLRTDETKVKNKGMGGRERKKDDLTVRCEAPLRLTFYIGKLENKVRNFILPARECRGE